MNARCRGLMGGNGRVGALRQCVRQRPERHADGCGSHFMAGSPVSLQ